MELLYLLKPLKLCFVNTYPFIPDNKEIKLVYVSGPENNNPPVECSYALIQRSINNKNLEWKQDYKLVCKLTNMNKNYFLYRHKNEPEISILNLIKESVSQYNKILFMKNPLFDSEFISVLTPEKIDSNHSILNWETYNSKEQYSMVFCNGEIQTSQFDIVVDPRNNYNRQYIYQFFEGYPCKIHTNKCLFERLETYKRVKTLKIHLISLQHKPNRRIGLKGQLDNYNLKYDLHFGTNGKMSILVPVNNMYKVEVEDEVYFYDPTVRPNNKILSPGEIGCAISHLKCYDKIDQHSLIIEDDAYINNWDMFFKTIRNLPETFDICYMQNEATWWPPVYDTPINEVICKTKGSVNLTIGYILTQRGKKALEYIQNIYKQRLNITGKFLCLPSDDLISHASRANLLYEISPYIRPISSQHLESHIGIVDTEKSKNYYKVSVEGIHDNWTGLGNQMFRYAVGKLLSVTTNSKFILPCQTKLNIAFKNIPVENIEFKNFEVWEEEEFKVIKNINSSIINQSINSNVLIKGYLQNASYFERYEYIVKEFFQFRDEIELSAKQYIQTIKNKYPSKQIVAVHIRVRDFIQETSEFLYELYTPSSLSSNIDLMKDDKNIFLVFSNNIEYVKTHFQSCFKDLNHEYVFTPTKQLGPHRDGILELCIMTLCDNYIISSSTYSWWGAFLSKNKNKKVIAPKVWLNPRREDLKLKDTSGIYCKDWIITE